MAKRTGYYHDWGRASKAFSYALLGAGKALTELGAQQLSYLGEEFLAEQDAKWPHSTFIAKGTVVTNMFGGDHDHPWYYGQLHDSVAVRIANGNKTLAVRYMPPAASAGPAQHTENDPHIIGAEWAAIAAQRAKWYLLPGAQIQLIIGVPYAEKVNESSRHLGFFDNLQTELINAVDAFTWKDGFTKTRVIADDKKPTRIVKVKGFKYR